MPVPENHIISKCGFCGDLNQFPFFFEKFLPNSQTSLRIRANSQLILESLFISLTDLPRSGAVSRKRIKGWLYEIKSGNSVVLKRYRRDKMNDLMTKSFTSYVDLKKNAMKDLEAGPDYNDDVELTATKIDPHLSQFLEEAEKVKEEMGIIRDILGRLQEANEESKSLHKPDSLKSLRDRINNDIVGVLKKARTIRSRIEDMDRSNAANRRLSAGGYKSGTPIDRARTSVTNGLRKKLKELMMDFQCLRQKIMAEHREMVGRRYFTVTGEQPEEDVIEKIISNGGEDFMLQRAVVDEQGRGKVLETVVEIKDRHAAAKETEQSLLELHQVFLDMAVMVEAQGEQMDDIEHHIFNAAHYVKDGTKNLNTAKGYQRSSRKWMCLGIILLLILILVIVIPIATSFSKS